MEIIAIALIIAVIIGLEAKIYEHKILPHMFYECEFSKPEIFEGEELNIIETVTNPTRFLMPCIKSEITTSNLLEFASEESTVNDKNRSLASLFVVHGKKRVKRVWQVKCQHRGCFKIEDTTIIGNDIFGVTQYSTLKKGQARLLVLPKPLHIQELLQAASSRQGDHVVRAFILQDPFVTAGTREYTPMDPMNRIHWGSTLRQGKLMVRNNEATAKKSVTVILNMQTRVDQYQGENKDKRIEWAIRLAAGESDKALKENLQIRILANACLSDSDKELVSHEMWGKAHIHNLLILLAKVNSSYSRSFEKFIAEYQSSINTTEIILITCYLDEKLLQFIKEKEQQGIWVKVYLMAYEADVKHYEGIQVYYILDYLKRQVKKNEDTIKTAL